MSKVFVGNLPFSMTGDGLKDQFETFGPVKEASIVMDRESGRSRGFGFVTFHDAQDADEAVRGMNGQEVGGRPLTVNLARTQGNAPRSGGRGRR